VNGDPFDNSAPEAGAAYSFDFTGGLWSQSGYIKTLDAASQQQFGTSVAIDSDKAIVGIGLGVGPTGERAYVFDLSAPASKCELRNGNGINPTDYTCLTLPQLGTTWKTQTAVTPTTLATIIVLGEFALSGIVSPCCSGELLITLPSVPTFLVGSGQFSVAIPLNPLLAGIAVPTQGFRLVFDGTVEALNALDLTLGY
jgi:hypothetical protein